MLDFGKLPKEVRIHVVKYMDIDARLQLNINPAKIQAPSDVVTRLAQTLRCHKHFASCSKVTIYCDGGRRSWRYAYKTGTYSYWYWRHGTKFDGVMTSKDRVHYVSHE